MTQKEQKWLVLLYTLIELDGGGYKEEVLHHIQSNHYWYKNDHNDEMLRTRPEVRWRNDFAFERHHLVQAGYISKEVRGKWILTGEGENYLYQLIE